MIEVLFGESEAASMKVAKNKIVSIRSDGPTAFFLAGKKTPPKRESAGWIEGTAGEVICLGFMLDIGDLRESVDSEYRKNLIYSMLNQGQWSSNPEIEQELQEGAGLYARELERLKTFIEAGEDIRIWYSKTPYSLCGLYYTCTLLAACQNKIFTVELPECRTHKNTAVSYQNWGEIAAEEFTSFLKYQKELSHTEIIRYTQLWADLTTDNSPLRTIINNHLIGVKEDFYDFIIWKKFPAEPVKEARLIGDILGSYRIGVSDWWYASRIQHHIQNGRIKVLEDSPRQYARLICKTPYDSAALPLP